MTNIPRRHNSYDNITHSDQLSKTSQFDSGKHSLTSSFSNYSNEVQNLIDFANDVDRPSINADHEFDPLYQHPHLFGGHIVPTSHDSLFSDTVSPVGGVRGFSPPPSQFRTQFNVSPRASTTDINPRPRPRPSSQDNSTSAPTSRPGTPNLRPQSSNISPSGSVQSLPPYPTSSEISYFESADSSTSIDLIDDMLFGDTDKMIHFHASALNYPYN